MHFMIENVIFWLFEDQGTLSFDQSNIAKSTSLVITNFICWTVNAQKL